MKTYSYRAWADTPEGDRLVDERNGITMPKVGGLIGNAAEGDVCRIIVLDELTNTVIIRYDRDSIDL